MPLFFIKTLSGEPREVAPIMSVMMELNKLLRAWTPEALSEIEGRLRKNCQMRLMLPSPLFSTLRDRDNWRTTNLYYQGKLVAQTPVDGPTVLFLKRFEEQHSPQSIARAASSFSLNNAKTAVLPRFFQPLIDEHIYLLKILDPDYKRPLKMNEYLYSQELHDAFIREGKSVFICTIPKNYSTSSSAMYNIASTRSFIAL